VLSKEEFHFLCEAPQKASAEVTIRTEARKWVYAQAAGDQPWLRVTTPNVSGPQQTAISFEVDSALIPAGREQKGVLWITANAGQRFQVRIHVEAHRPRGYRTPPPPPRPAAAPPPIAATIPPAPVRLHAVLPDAPTTTVTPRPVEVRAGPQPALGPFQFDTTPPSVRSQPRQTHGGGVVHAILAGALLALLLRAALLLPADLYARVIARSMDSSSTPQPPTAGWDFWRLGPMTDGVIDPGFLRQFVLATWWIGVVGGLILVWRRGGRGADMACGAVAGLAAGVGGGATLGCLLVVLDGLPRAILDLFNSAAGSSAASMSPLLATPLWFLLALGSWTFLGGLAGLALAMLGARGGRILSAGAAPLIWALRACGLTGIASFFALQ
ncbi:MAG TPA: hypothetical protein VMS17_23700, partial [Gemmataceae bacterium]|nr:hypothetical protein [Gemmataceae bacterium]